MTGRRSNLAFKHGKSRLLHAYADWRIKPTELEKHCYKTSDSILLTFDDFGSDEQIDSILATLRDKRARAVFFLQGDWAEKHKAAVKRIAGQGHFIGNHTYSHPDLLSMDDQSVIEEIRKGLPGPWFRPPQGRYNNRIRQIAKQEGRHICYWTIDSQDWTEASADYIRHTIFSELKPGAVVLFHLHGRLTKDLLPGIIDGVRQRGYELTGFNETWSPDQT